MRLCETCKGLQEGESSSIGGHSVMRGHGFIIFFYEMETQAAACGSFPAQIFMDYVMFATSEDGDPQKYFPYKPRSFSLRVHLSEQNRALDPLRTMDDIVFYQPPLASRSQSLRFPGTITASHLPPGTIASLPAHKTATLVSKKTHTSDPYCRNDKPSTCRNLLWGSQLLTA